MKPGYFLCFIEFYRLLKFKYNFLVFLYINENNIYLNNLFLQILKLYNIMLELCILIFKFVKNFRLKQHFY